MLVLVEYPGVCCVFFLCGGREGGGVGLVGVFCIFGRVVLLIGWWGYCFGVVELLCNCVRVGCLG